MCFVCRDVCVRVHVSVFIFVYSFFFSRLFCFDRNIIMWYALSNFGQLHCLALARLVSYSQYFFFQCSSASNIIVRYGPGYCCRSRTRRCVHELMSVCSNSLIYVSVYRPIPSYILIYSLCLNMHGTAEFILERSKEHTLYSIAFSALICSIASHTCHYQSVQNIIMQ